MCDFRNPPTFVINTHTGEKLPANYQGNYNGTQDEVKVGTYYICCTGSYYSYYDGSGWYCDMNGWGNVTEIGKSYWPPNGRPPKYDKYKFEFGEENTQGKRLLGIVIG